MNNKTNQHRAQRATGALEHYVKCQKHEAFYEDFIDESDVTDLIADLMHLCEVEALSFDECLRMAVIHYEAESNGEDDYLNDQEETHGQSKN